MGLINRIVSVIKGIISGKIDENEIIKKDEKTIEEIHSIWDYLRFTTQSQAHHITSILGFEEWTDMEEILRRISEVFGAKYRNERSLYPYIKTLVDCGLIETSAFGGKRKWRKKEILIKIATTKTQNIEEAWKREATIHTT